MKENRIKKVDEKTLKLIAHLRQNSREKLTAISRKTNIPVSTLFDLLNSINQDIIIRPTVLLDFVSLGFQCQAQVFIKVKGDKDSLVKHLMYSDCVNSVYKLNDSYDFVIETVHRSIRDLDRFLEELDQKYGVKDKKIHYLVDELKREGSFMLRAS